MTDSADSLSAALDQFDRVEANIKKLEKVWAEILDLWPQDIAFGLDTDELDDLRRAFDDIVSALPPIDGFTINARPESADAIAQARLDYREIGEFEDRLGFEREIEAPGRELAEYRYRLHSSRRSIVQRQVQHVVTAIDELLADVFVAERSGEWKAQPRWGELTELVERLDRLVGETVPGNARWSDLRRHLYFAESNDLSDIKTMDWPSVRAEVMSNLYGDREPIPIDVDDLGALARSQPTGPVSTRLSWEQITDEDFERLVFELIRSADGYENTNWLMATRAPDRGRDIQTDRVVRDVLSGTRRCRVIVQCKHWTTRSVGRDDIVQCREAVTLWEPPPVDVLIVATSGRFSQDAVARVERWREERAMPTVEMWAESDLETLLARRPHLIASFGLR